MQLNCIKETLAAPASWEGEYEDAPFSDDDASLYFDCGGELDAAQAFDAEGGEYLYDVDAVPTSTPGQLAWFCAANGAWEMAARLRRYGHMAFQVRCAIRRLVPRANVFVCIRPAQRPARSCLGAGDEPDAATCGAQPCLRPVVPATRRRLATCVTPMRSVVGKEVRHVRA